MSDTVIRVENLSKKYIIGHQKQERYTSLRDVISNGAKSFWQGLTGDRHKEMDDTSEEFWALKDVSFEIKQGDRVGIIGRNGAGKSTLLKILSRITEPTSGKISIKGRVASLLEVGTGFHPELTGRENVYLNGAILGMDRVEIKKKFDEIVAFAEVEKFLDTPVKRYSSGMYVRLAFAVAAHLEPEILIVDEVLAVGDAQFQDKCLGKMDDVSKDGRTIVFVSHNMESIRRLCNIGIFMQGGRVREQGTIEYAVLKYLGQYKSEEQGNVIYFDNKSKNGFYIDRIEILELDGSVKDLIYTWDSVKFRVVFFSPEKFKSGSVVLQLSTLSGVVISLCSTQPDSSVSVEFCKGINQIDCVFPKLMLSSGKYLLGAGLAIPNAEWLYKELDYGVINIESQNVFNSGLAPDSSRYIIPQPHFWEVL